MLIREGAALLTSRVIAPSELSCEELSRWRDLCSQRDDLRTPFLAPEFSISTAKARPGVRVCVIASRGEIFGFLPFQFATRAHSILSAAEPVASPLNDYFGLIARSDLRLGTQTLMRLAGLTYLGFSHLHEGQLCHGLDAEKPEPGLQICLPNGGAAYWEMLRQRDKKFADDTNRRERRLAKDIGPLTFRFSDDTEDGLDRLLKHKRQQYRRSGVGDVLGVIWRRRLLRILAASSAPNCQGVLSTLYAGNTWIASHFGLLGNGILHYWFPVYNRQLQAYAPGRLLLKHIIYAVDQHGVRIIDRGAGDSQAKREFANAHHTYFRGAWHRPGVRSMLYRANCSLQWRAQAMLSQCSRHFSREEKVGILST